MKLAFMLGLSLLLATATAFALPSDSAASAAGDGGGAGNDLPVLKREPAAGHLHTGEKVLVDDGTCPAGEIKELTGGSNRQCGKDAGLLDPGDCRLRPSGAPRTARCIPHK
jgi:hypothetical protein